MTLADAPTSAVAKVFMSGRSQAVRLPKAFRLDVSEVRVRREGAALILEPIEPGWDWLGELPGALDADFAAAVREDEGPFERPDPMPGPAGGPDQADAGAADDAGPDRG